jgi:hypothetical protein
VDQAAAAEDPGVTDLIYMTVRDPPYRHMLVELVDSLRRVGRYAGEIVVFTPDICPVLQQLTEPPHRVRLYTATFREDGMYDRVLALTHIPGHQYRTVTCLDADILCFRTFAPIIADDAHIRFMEERWQTLRICGDRSMYGAAMTLAERTAAADCYAINAGHFTIPGSLFKAFTEVYVPEAMRLTDFGADQAALNAIVRRGIFPVKAWGPLEVGNGSMSPEDTWAEHILIHYAGYGDGLYRARRMHEINARTPTPPPIPTRGVGSRRDREIIESLRPRLREPT